MDEQKHVLLWAGRSTLLLLLLLADLANGLALAALWCRPAVRSPSNRFVVSLLIANLLGCGALVPLQLLDTSSDGTVRPIICAFGEAVASAFCTASILSVLLIVGDQYRAVSSPLHYHSPSLVGGKAGIGGVWVLTALVGAAAAITSPQQSTLWLSCGFSGTASASSGVRVAFTVIFGLLVIAAPFAALCWLYAAICDVARGNEARARRCSTVSSSGTGDGGALGASQSVPAIADTVRADPQDPDDAPPAEEARRHSCPVPARFRRRMSLTIEARAARVSVGVAAMALLCWTPFSVILALHAMSPTTAPPRLADQLAFGALAASAIVSPWLFAYRSRRLRLEIIAVPRRMSRFQVLGSPL